MKRLNKFAILTLLITSTWSLYPKLNSFGISDIFPTKADDNATFDLRIQEEMMNGKKTQYTRQTRNRSDLATNFRLYPKA